ncbi:neurogenic locus notch homolog protein 3 isoform X2 [Protopterus annectens]|uniref:neurogenic locus notch homolog protein 3 isoform X2 n=1 Tax=Protopterus annectens TaxID=7888 RepID=UPI001CFB0D7E|nr:neurogenic locus notch homolog protein 3 isoform X2 [Protopterus annectens]
MEFVPVSLFLQMLVLLLISTAQLMGTAALQCPNEKCEHGGWCAGSSACRCLHGFIGEKCQFQDPCHSSPCFNGGVCRSSVSGGTPRYSCICPRGFRGFEGQNCEINVDDCPGHKCMNGGTCVDGVNTYNCQCPPEWTGQFCTEDVDECHLQPNACHNGGTCFNTMGGHTCVCVNGWTGDDCSENIDDCATAVCFNGATCHDRVASFFCECPFGKTGLLCHLDDACVSNPCHEDAICDTNPVNGRAICTCPAGFTGGACNKDIDECSIGANPCEHFGKCLNTMGSFQCQCGKGYTGPRCETDINECLSMPCQNDATCLDRIGEFTCICMPGFTGTFCETNINECESNPCVNNGVCKDLVNGFLCSCPSGFTGSMCQMDIDECASTPCQNGAKCIDTPNGYECHCAEGFEGTLCERNINDCDPDPCHHGTCVDGIISYTCICKPGYTGYRCENQVNECGSNPCQNGGKCVDLVNKYSCRCLPGTSGLNCEINFDDCASNPCTFGICRDGINRYDCVCKPGFTGRLCDTEINECASNPCRNGGTCEDRENGFVCHCPEGFHDQLCFSEVDECSSSPCVHGACTDDLNGYKCDCEPGWVGTNCDINKNECESNPCQNGGICMDHINGYSCRCREGFRGTYCQINIDECASNPCLNKGTCVDGIASYTCYCDLPYTGRNCETVLAPCNPNPCENGGVCDHTPDYENFICTCAQGWQGQRCNKDINECAQNPCKNQGTCFNNLGGYTCTCRAGFTGTNCETDINDCASNPCVNGGTCLDGINAFRCTCMPGFTGPRCATEINECLSSPCRNGGTCSDYVNSFTCTCKPGFTGIHCEENIPDCTDSSCFNGGTCIDQINGYSCNCRVGFTGSNCQYEIDECDSMPCLNGGVCSDGVESYHCTCPHGYTGAQCQNAINWCSKSLCKNGGRCWQSKGSFGCECPSGWTGRYCDIPNVSCEVAAAQRDMKVEQLCRYGGHCVNTGNSHYCMCQTSYTGSYCESEVNHCDPDPCLNGASCTNYLGGYFCECPSGFEGKSCESEIDECHSHPCQNGGTCIDLVGHYICSCPPGTMGVLCEINDDDCVVTSASHGPKCMNNGTCVDKVGGYRCNCPPGFTGERCEGDINECLSDPCHPHNTIDCIQLPSDYHCVCKLGFTGHRCQSSINLCESQPCKNGGQCKVANNPQGYTCRCPPNYAGINCERSILTCRELTCYNGGKCISTTLGARCNCLSGFGGTNCVVRFNSSCANSPCLNGGICREDSHFPYFQCQCRTDFTGRLCELRRIFPSPPPVVEEPRCPIPECSKRAGNRYCDKECNAHACQWDGGDCSLNISDPWKKCEDPRCLQFFNNSRCDEVCNTPECLYDNFNCKSQEKTCNPVYENYCIDHFQNGNCDQGCNNEECGWDGMDCAGTLPEHLAEGVLVIVVLLPPQELLKTSATFLLKLSSILHTSLRFRLDDQGNYMVYPYYHSSRIQKRELEKEVIGSIVNLVIDNRLCFQVSEKCFPDAESAAAYLAALYAVEQLPLPYPLMEVRGEKVIMPAPGKLLFLVAVAAVILVIILILGVLIARRKREHSTLWFPEGFIMKKENSNKNRREPVGQDALGMKSICRAAEESLISDHSEQWIDPDCPETKRLKLEEPGTHSDSEDPVDCRQWTQHHLAAADIRMPPSMALTPPQGEFDTDCMDINVRGPDGFTPLMLASFCGVGLETDVAEEEEPEDASANIISDLIYQGANLGAQTDRTGETALHLAARYARADAAKRLLDAGADANAQDNTGRTPLHAAVAADAQGVFQILIRNRATDLDARMADGSTALILAARLAVEGMVEDLITCHADVNAVDELGKSALHWAAAVNNIEATRALLKNGANKDMQNLKEETPLFLAAREGSYEAAKILLEHFANREITDHMDRLPRDIAQERMHHDIVQLLEEYNTVRSPQGPGASISNHTMSPLMCPPTYNMSALKQTPQGKKARRPSNKNTISGSNANLAREAKESKARNKKLSLDCQGSLMESSVTLSPVDSLDSPHTYITNPASPVVASPGLFHTSPSMSVPSTPVVHGLIDGPFAVSLARLNDIGEVGSVQNAAILSMNSLQSRVSMSSVVRQPNCVLNTSSAGLNLGMVNPVNTPVDWHGRITTQCTPVINVIHPANSHPNIHQQSQVIPHGMILSNRMPMIHGSQVLTQQSPIKMQLVAEQQPIPPVTQGQQLHAPPTSNHPLQQNMNRNDLPIVNQPVSPQEIQQPPNTGSQYFKQQSNPGLEDYPTPPSQHSYTTQDSTPKHYLHVQNEHPYLTPSPESPEQWSSPSPHSMSDWSDSTPSPAVVVPVQTQLTHMPEQANKMQVFA